MLPILGLIACLLLPADGDTDLRKLVKDAKSKSYAVRLEAYDKLIDLGPRGIQVLESILRYAEEKARKDFLNQAHSRGASAFRKKLKSDIKEARKEALKIIMDRNIYPDDAHGAVGQPKVDHAVARLRQLWLRPGRLFIDRVPEINNSLYYIKEAAQYLKRAGLNPNYYDEDLKEAYKELDEQFDPMSFMYSGSEQKEIEELYEYNATCPSTATDEERRYVRILNDYRVMLGLKVLEIDERLVVACRKHSQEMMDMNYFAHVSPVAENKSPQMRVAREGYGGGVGENCAISGDARDAFEGWYHSSGHHRLLVTTRSKQVGIGHSVSKSGGRGRHWTMLAGSANSLRGKQPKGNPRLIYLSRLDKLEPQDAETRFILARFCIKNELVDEGHELLNQVVKIEPDHKKAHLMLGHVKSNGRWVTAEQKLLEDLENKSPEEVLAEVKTRLGAEDAATRLAAVNVVEKIGDRKGVPILVLALKDDASEVRAEACDVLAKFEATEAIGPLKGLLGDRSFYVAHSAAAALWRLGDASGVPTLFRGLRNRDLSARIDAHRKARLVFGRDFGYAWDLPATKRARVVDEWEEWSKGQQPLAPGNQ